MDWKRLGFLDWFLGVFAAIGFAGYGVYCIVMQEGVIVVPFHSIEMGSTSDGLSVYGTAAVRTGISYLFWAVFCHFAGIWKAHRRIDRETWGKITMALFAAAIVSLLWAMFSM